MEPLKPPDKLEILQRAQSADPSEVEEYEKLLSQRFTTDPDATPPATTESVGQGARDDRSRLRELYKKFAKRAKP
jgi:hypothetical protein